MPFSFSRLSTLFKKSPTQGRDNTRARQGVLFWGVVAVAVVFVLALLGDAYVFYEVVRRGHDSDQAPPAPLSAEAPILTARDIDNVVRLLDVRSSDSTALLGSGMRK